MARVSVFGRMSGDGREVTLGGRSANNNVRCWINTDTGRRSNVSIKVSGESLGARHVNNASRPHMWHNCRANNAQRMLWKDLGEGDNKGRVCPHCNQMRPGIDDRSSHFTVELPEGGDDVQVEIVAHNEGLRNVAKIGALLVGVKGILESGRDENNAVKLLKFSSETLQELEEAATKNLPNVTLPGGFTLAHAAACVAMCEAMKTGTNKN